MLGGGQEVEKATQTMVASAGLGPGCWVLSDLHSTSYLFLWSASYSMLISGGERGEAGFLWRKGTPSVSPFPGDCSGLIAGIWGHK